MIEGTIAQLNRKDAETVERIGDRIGVNNPSLANLLYRAAGDLRFEARMHEEEAEAIRSVALKPRPDHE